MCCTSVFSLSLTPISTLLCLQRMHYQIDGDGDGNNGNLLMFGLFACVSLQCVEMNITL